MREIKFRAWVEEHNLMVYPDKDSESNVFVYNPNGFFTVAIEDIDDQANPIYIDYDVSKTTMQYTGLKDKNGIEIYENDILMAHNNKDDLCKVVYGEFNVIDVESLESIDRVIGIYTEVIKTDEISTLEPFCLDMPLTNHYIKYCEYEVIGNIYENPELLQN